MNISLTPELMKLVQRKVKAGYYNNSSEVIRDSLRRMDEDAEMLYQYKLEKLREALKPGYEEVMAGKATEYSYDDLMRDLNEKKV